MCMALNSYQDLHPKSHRDVHGDAEDLRCLLITKWDIAQRKSCGEIESEIRGVNIGRLLSIGDVVNILCPLLSRRIRFSQLLCCIVTYER